MKKILVIGGSSGIGLSILQQQSQRHECINMSRRQPNLSLPFKHHPIDVLKDDIPKLAELDGLVYCPGTILLKPISSLKPGDFLHDYEVNVLGAVKAIKANLCALKKSESASIVLFSTVAVAKGMAFHSSISAAKGAVEGLTRSLAAELAPRIRVNCIAPGITETPLSSHILRTEALMEKTAQMHPLKKIAQAEDVANLADFLLHGKSASITGQVLGVDNGMSSLRV